MSAELKIDPSQFLEEVMALVLASQQVPYTPVMTYRTKLELSNLKAIVNVILDFYTIMTAICERHVEEVVLAFHGNPKPAEFFDLVGKSLFIDRPFEWKYFLAFLALVSKLSNSCHKKHLVYLSDDIVVTAAHFIERNLQSHISECGGWKKFEEDCIDFKIEIEDARNRDRIRAEIPPKPSNNPLLSEIPSTSTTPVEIHVHNFHNTTIGRCYVYKPPEENYVEPIVYLGPELVTSKELQHQMTSLVIEVFEISSKAFKKIYDVK